METTNNALKDFSLSANSKDKSSKEFGAKIITQIDSFIRSGYFTERNERIAINRAAAAGKTNTDKYKDMMDMAGKKNYANISWKGIMIVNTIISRLVGRWMQLKEKPKVRAVDPISVKEKQDERDEAEFILENKDFLASIQEQSGVPMVGKDQFVPDDKDHLDIWAHEEQRLPEEILYEKGIDTVINQSDFGYKGVNLRRIKEDSAVTGLCCSVALSDKKGKVCVDYIKPENSFYSYTERPDFKDCAWMGDGIAMTISQIRDSYPKVSEKDLFENLVTIASQFKTSGLNQYDTGWENNSQRPYDDFKVELIRFEYKSLDDDNYEMKVTKNGNLIIDKVQGKSTVNGEKEKVNKKVWNIYKGVYSKQNQFQLEWAIKENPVSPQDEKDAANKDFSYAFYMTQNNKMRNVAIPEKIEEPVEMMILTRLKIQQLVANMRASGLLIDIDGVQEINLGTGEGNLTPMALNRVYDQKGDYYYRGKDAEGNRIENPIRELPNAGSVPQLQQLILLYNFHYQVLKDELGEDPNLMQQASRPRVANGNVEIAQEEADNATDHYNLATITMVKMAAAKVACLLHNSVEFGSKVYRDIVNEEDVKGRVFEVDINFLPDEQEIAEFMQMVYGFIQTSPAMILYINPFKLKSIAQENVKLASIYFRRAQKRAIEGESQKVAQQSQMNADAQTQSAMQKAQADQQNMQMQIQLQDVAESKRSKEKMREIALQGMFAIWSKGIPMPQELSMVTGETIHNLLLPIFAENAQMSAAASEMQHPMAQDENQQEQQGEQQPEIPQEQQQDVAMQQPMQ